MKRRLRCRLGLHKWVVMQDHDTTDAPKYHGCRYCDKIMDSDKRPFIGMSDL